MPKRRITRPYIANAIIAPVNDAELGGIVRALRHRRGWRQADLAGKAGVSASLISLLERGHAEALSIQGVRRIGSALDLRLGFDAGFRGAELARLRDADHARLAEWLTRRLERFGWTVVPEASFNQYGDRGRIDLLAFHAVTNTLAVIEIKTVIAEIQDLLGTLNAKERVAPTVARSHGWRATGAVAVLVVAESTTNRRRLADHSRLFARFGLRGKGAVAWIRKPSGTPSGLLLLAKLPDRKGVGVRRAGRQRVRRGRAAVSVDGARGGVQDPPKPA
ncbi:MAG: helix-turn-helix domain-containing protein [Chloroflexota bacterium]